MARKAWVEHRRKLRLLGQERGHLLGVVAVPLHAHRQRLQPAQREPGVEGAGDGTHRVLVVSQVLAERRVPHHQGTPQHV